MLRAAIGFEHCVRNVVDSWFPSAGWLVSRHPNVPTSGKGLLVNSDGWLTVPEGMSPSGESYAHLDLRPFMDTSGKAAAIHFGFRAKLLKAGVAGSGATCLWPSNPSTLNTHALATYANLFPTGSPEGTEVLVEVTLNLATTYRYLYVNGVLINAAVYTGLSTAFIQAGDFGIFFGLCASSTSAVVAVRDIWVTDDLPGDGMVGRLGDMKVRPVTIAVASGAGWTASDGGSLLDALNAPVDKVNPAVVESSLGAEPLTLQLANTIPVDQAVHAVQFFLNGKGTTSTAQTDVSLVRNGVSTPKRRIALDPVQKLRPAGVWTVAPDGSRWTAGTLASTSIKITPE